MNEQPKINSSRGMTFIEIMVVIAILATMIGVGATVFFPGDGSKLRDQSGQLAGTIKFLYNESAIKKKYFRIVFNLDEHSYKIESSTEPFYVTLEDEKEPKAKTPNPGQGAENPAQPPAFSEEDNYLTKSVKLESGTKIKDILIYHNSERKTQGIEYLYFFPSGWVEPAVINLSDEDETLFYSLEINPLTGKAKIRDQYLEVKPEDLKSTENPS